jgi:hypothetical protein
MIVTPRLSLSATAALVAGLLAALPCLAQQADSQATDNPAVTAAPQAESSSAGDLWTPKTQSVAPKTDRLFHRHSSGEDEKPPAPLRPVEATKDPAFPEQTGRVGLVEDDSPLPGEMADTPETRKPLFMKSTSGLAQQPDPWFVPKK